MAFTYRALRSHISGRRPPGSVYRYGELYVNTADEQIGVISEQGLPLDLIGIRFFRNTAVYKDGDYIVHDGHLWRATGPIPAGNFNPDLWERSGADLSIIDYDPDLGYQQGDFVFINGLIYEALQDIAKPAGPFDEALWQTAGAGGGSGLKIGDVYMALHLLDPQEATDMRRLILQGQEIPRVGEYAELFAVWGTQFGAGNGASTFNVPDMRGRVPRGVDEGLAVDIDGSGRYAQFPGAGVNVGPMGGTLQDDEFKSHTHQVRLIEPENDYINAPGAKTGFSKHKVFNWYGPHTALATGGHETRMKNIGVHWYVQY